MRCKYYFVVLIVVGMMMLSSTLLCSFQAEPSKMIEQDVPDEEVIDVGISNLTFSKEKPREGENVTIFVTVMNNESMDLGELTFIDKVNITLMHFEDFLFAWENITVGANSSKTFEFTWQATSGMHSFTAVMFFEIQLLNMSLPWSSRSAILEVDPEPIGNLYFPVAMLLVVFGIVGAAILAPAFFERIPYLQQKRR